MLSEGHALPHRRPPQPLLRFPTIAAHLPGPGKILLLPTLIQSILYFQLPVTPLGGTHITLISPVHSDSKVLNLTGYTEISPAQRPKHLQSRPADQCLYTPAAGSGYKCQHQWIQGGKSLHRSQTLCPHLSPAHHGSCNFFWAVPIQIKSERHHLAVVSLQLTLDNSVTLV